MASGEKELEEQLLEAGNKLVDPPSSVDNLLPLLDQVESCLSRVEQSPTECMQSALSPSLKALIADKLIRHSEVDVKVAVASCISEITRITAPDAPYDDDQMKEVFQLIVSSFENLHDNSSRSYTKRTSILETVAKVRSCVVMLDLECDALILEMFQLFLKTIREHHPESVFTSMETIMTLVLEESEDISPDLLSPILASIKKDNEEVLPVARKLCERVLESCATKLKPYLVQAVNTLGISLDDYSDVLASICRDTSCGLEQKDVRVTSDNLEDENKSAKEPAEESSQLVRENAKETAAPQLDNPVGDRSPKSVVSNGTVLAGQDETLAELKSPKKQVDTSRSVQSVGINLSGNEEPNNLDPETVDNSELKPEQASKKGGRKANSSKLAESSERSYVADEKEDEKMIDSKGPSMDVPSSPHEDDCVEAAGPSENDKEIAVRISSPKAGDGESDTVASPSLSGSIHQENRSKKRGQAKKKDNSAKEVVAEDVSKKVSEGTSDSEAKSVKPSAKKGLGRVSDLKKTTMVDAVTKGIGTVNDPDVKKHSAKITEEKKKDGGGSSSKQPEDKKKKGRGKGNSEKGQAKTSAKDEDKELVSLPKSTMKSTKEHSEETPKTNKRKHTPGKDNESNTIKYGKNLLGARVKVWWPDDAKYYEGIIDGFDSGSKKHKVSYDDGDVEILFLKKEKWEIIEDGADSDGEGGGDHSSPAASADMPPKKKGKASTGESKKEGKRESSSKSGGATSSKSRGASVKSSQKSKDGSKSDRKSKDSKTVGESEDEVSRKSKDHSVKSGGKPIDAAQKSKSKITDSSKINKSKDEDVDALAAKSKQETSKAGKSKKEASKTPASKAKSTRSGGKSNKVKSNLVKTKDSENENSEDSTEEVEDTKGKISSSSKAGNEAKSAKKRGRNVDETRVKSNLLKAKDSDDEKSEDSTEEVEEMKVKTSSSLKAGKAKSGKKSGRNVEGNRVKSNLLKAKDSENEKSEDSTEEVEENTKVRTSSSLKAGNEAKSGKKRGRNVEETRVKSNLLKAKDLENENSEDSTEEVVEEMKVKTSSSLKAGNEAKSGKKRGRN